MYVSTCPQAIHMPSMILIEGICRRYFPLPPCDIGLQGFVNARIQRRLFVMSQQRPGVGQSAFGDFATTLGLPLLDRVVVEQFRHEERGLTPGPMSRTASSAASKSPHCNPSAMR